MNRIISAGIASAVLVSGMVASAVPASAAPQGCAEVGMTGYKITNKSTVYKATNLKSDWFLDKDKPTLGYESNKTGTVSASGTAGVEAEAGAIFASASASFSVTVGKEWSKSQTWQYSAQAVNKKGKTKVRLVMSHESKKFKARKWIVTKSSTGACTTKWKWSKAKTFVAPAKKGSNVWRLQYK